MTTVFFYGLFMDAAGLREQGFHPERVRLAVLHGYGLRIGDRATLERSETEQCYGTLIELEQAELERLYSGDSVAAYRPSPVEAREMDGRLVTAVCYLLPMSQVSGSNHNYARQLASVAGKLNLPRDYIDEIETWT